MTEKKTPKSPARAKAPRAKAARKKAARRPAAPRAEATAAAPKLLIVESPTKVRTLKKFLGPEFAVMASRGHVRDLRKTGERRMGIDIENGFRADYGPIPAKQKTIEELRRAARAAKEVYLAPDPDREGEAIAWHIQEILGDRAKEDRIFRVSFNEITRRAVTEALRRPGRIDRKKVDAQETRRKLDRIVGFKLSGEILWNKVAFGLSAGRVQSVALRLVSEREDEIEAFEPQEYWTITATVEKPGTPPPFEARLHRLAGEEPEIRDEARAKEIARAIEGAALRVSRIERRERRRRPPAPFITSTLQQEGSNKLRFGAKRTMGIAQSLYEGVSLGRELGTVGLITYMRTDSVRVAPEAVASARAFIGGKYGKPYLPAAPPTYRTRDSAQDAHEAIRPTDVALTPERVRPHLKPEQLSLYTLIWRRFVASQMTPAVYDQTSVDIEAGEALLRATGSVLKFPGFLAVHQGGSPQESAQPAEAPSREEAPGGRDRLLPPLEETDPLSLVSTGEAPAGVLAQQHFTQPPPRYTEASLVKELEEDGVGRPSTYATILDTLEKRKYVTVDRRKRQMLPTSLGREVNRLLSQGFPDEVNVKFTARMESDLDEIEKGATPWLPVLRDFYRQFDQKVQEAKKTLPSLKTAAEPIGRACPECGKPLVKKFSKNGWFISCSGYPECTYSESIPTAEGGEEEPDEELARIEEKAPPCEVCGAPMKAKSGRYGPYLACSAAPRDHPTRKVLRGGQVAAPPRPTGIACAREGCGGELVERRSRRTGKPFYGCSEFPRCNYVVWDRPVAQPCPACGHPHMTLKTTKREGTRLVCPVKSCGRAEPVPPGLLARLEAEDKAAGGEKDEKEREGVA